MCGSLLSKFRKKNNIVYPGITIFPKPGKNKSTRRPSNDDSACHENRGFWDNGDQTKVSETRSLASPHPRKNLLKDAISSQCEAGAVPALDRARRVLPAVNSTNVASSLATRNSDNLLESAREILAIHGYRTSSTCSSTQPLSSINPTFPEQKTVVALNKAVTDEKTICPSSRVSLRLRRRVKVASEITLADVHEKRCAAEERKLKELEHVRDQLESRIEQKKQKTEKGKVKQQQRRESKKEQKELQEKCARKVKDRVS